MHDRPRLVRPPLRVTQAVAVTPALAAPVTAAAGALDPAAFVAVLPAADAVRVEVLLRLRCFRGASKG